jgi:hypothetical protein
MSGTWFVQTRGEVSGMPVAEVVVSLILAWVSWYFIAASVRTWRGAGTPLSQRSATTLLDPEARAGVDRGGLVFGLGFGFLAVFLAGFALAKGLHAPAHSRIVGGALSAAAVGMIICVGLGCTIVEFNWPKFLVPPRLRGEPGGLRGRAPTASSGQPEMTEPPAWLRPGERVLSRIVANHVQRGRPMEGRLYMTSHRLMFVPWPASVARGGGSSSIPWPEVAGADVAERGSGEVSTRRRLRVTKVSGQAELYVVWRPAKAVRLVEEARRGSEQ